AAVHEPEAVEQHQAFHWAPLGKLEGSVPSVPAAFRREPGRELPQRTRRATNRSPNRASPMPRRATDPTSSQLVSAVNRSRSPEVSRSYDDSPGDDSCAPPAA